MRIVFNNSGYCNEMHNYIKDNNCTDHDAQSLSTWHYFLKIASFEDFAKVCGMKIDRFNVSKGCFIFSDENETHEVIVARDNTDLTKICIPKFGC